MQKTTWLAVMILLGAISSFADDTPRADVAAGYSFMHLGAGSNAQGGSFSLAANANRWFGMAGDFGAYTQSSVNTFTALGGPRFSVRTESRFTPYVETLFGGAHFSTRGFGGTNGFAFLAGGGLDLGMSPSVALRPQLDYVAIRTGGSTLNSARISVGLAFRFGAQRSRR